MIRPTRAVTGAIALALLVAGVACGASETPESAVSESAATSTVTLAVTGMT